MPWLDDWAMGVRREQDKITPNRSPLPLGHCVCVCVCVSEWIGRGKGGDGTDLTGSLGASSTHCTKIIPLAAQLGWTLSMMLSIWLQTGCFVWVVGGLKQGKE